SIPIVLQIVDTLELPLHGFERPIDRRHMVLLGLSPLLYILAYDEAAVRYVDLDRDSDRHLTALGTTMRHIHDDATSDDARMDAPQRLRTFPDERIERRRAIETFVGDLQRSLHGNRPL